MNDERFGANRETEHSARANRRGNQLSALEALEQGFSLFQASFAREAWRYYVGAAPLLICFVPLWAVTGQVRLPDEALRAGAAVLSAAYLLRTVLVGQYVRRVRERTFGVPRPRRSNASAYFAALGRTIVWKLILGGLALATLPLVVLCPWFYSASQYATLEAQQDSTERHSLSGCLALAGQWSSGSVLLLFLLLPLWIAVLLNCLILAVLVPQLLHAIFGVSSLLSTPSGPLILFSSSSFWLALLAGAWLALDPVVKCTYLVVYQHLRSRREGDDLRSLLARLPRGEKSRAAMMGSGRTAHVGVYVLLLACLLVGFPTKAASGRQTNGGSTQDATQSADDSVRLQRVDRLDKAVKEESQRAIYRWHGAESPQTPGWLATWQQKLGHAIDRAREALGKLLRKLWPRRPPGDGGKTGPWRMRHVRLWLALLAILAASTGAFLFWMRYRRGEPQRAVPIPTLSATGISEAALASERPEREWFALAASLQQKGDLRLAFRAAYLGLLAGLAEREWLTIRRDRTNREYLEEFTRRWGRRPRSSAATEIPERLRGSLRLFDRVWYGSHPLTAGSVEAYRCDQWELLQNV